MSLPPGFLDELRNRTSLAHVVGRKVIWDTRKSNQGKGDMWSPCPFHQEKTASFHVDDRKGFYYCFGCHAKGDAISFVRETENVSFMEAIDILAREAGMQVPKADPQEQQRAEKRASLADVMEMAVRFYRTQLQGGAAQTAREYLTGRGLKAKALERFEIGFAPDGRRALFEHLAAKGVEEKAIIDAGLAALPDDGGPAYDRFRNRIVFPIRDARGRCIAFGGRAMAANARAKYLNSPETVLFDKGRSLYNHGPAREAAGKGAALIVAEGYMDVIALVEAGFDGAVAPLGTAITENQLQLLWRIAPEPVIALDGDKAGLRAAMRVMDLALPMLEAGRSLRFCLMPEGKDPDDLLRAEGAGAMRRLLERAEPMVRLLWRRETEDKVFDSPERRAALDKTLREATGRIRDPDLRRHYDEELKRLKWDLFAPASRRTPVNRRRGGFGRLAKIQPSPALRNSRLAVSAESIEDEMREAVILATILRTPAVLDHYEGVVETLALANETHARLRDAILSCANDAGAEFMERVESIVGGETLESFFAQPHLAVTPAVRHAGNPEMARMCLAEELAKLETRRGLAQEVREASEDVHAGHDEHLVWRLSQATEARNRADRQQMDDNTEYDTSPNGAKLNRDERSAFDELIRDINFSRTRGR
ncbi:DNA primase [Qingshengfaniella alkalisoli]|uniref:DNA primase n=1 Tax=Qingshengfaniella alkalisoli TaxID=2599296 RepID=A0A5B8J2Q0_9RHOB|nr:DNA primase [Qingshengfaniella alkalisoli]QDY68797.1 DNA primase [Qingshengfaniella alkalisoli]